MTFRDQKTGKTYSNLRSARMNFCIGKDCNDCPLNSRDNGTGYTCGDFTDRYPDRAMRLMNLAPVSQDGDDAEQRVPDMADPDKKPTRRSILRDAEKCVVGDREQDYGSPENSFAVIGKLWGIYLEEKCLRDGRITILPEDTAALMCLFKTARVATGHGKADNWVDLAGYAACGGEIEGGKK